MSLIVPLTRVASTRERRMILSSLAIAALAAVTAGESRADGLSPIVGAFGETKPIVDLRLRTETVEQEPLADDAHATTLRLRAGFETGKAWNTALLIEGEGIMPIGKSYRPDPMIPEMTTYPGGRGRGGVRDQPVPAHQHQPAGHDDHARAASASRSTTSASWVRWRGGRTSRLSMRCAW